MSEMIAPETWTGSSGGTWITRRVPPELRQVRWLGSDHTEWLEPGQGLSLGEQFTAHGHVTAVSVHLRVPVAYRDFAAFWRSVRGIP